MRFDRSGVTAETPLTNDNCQCSLVEGSIMNSDRTACVCDAANRYERGPDSS